MASEPKPKDRPEGSSGFEGLEKIKPPNMSALLCSRPNNVVSGTIAGLGNSVGGVLAAVGKFHHMLFVEMSFFSLGSGCQYTN
jgi:hypothetical protein